MNPLSSQRAVQKVNVGGPVWIPVFERGFSSFPPRRCQNCSDPKNSIQKIPVCRRDISLGS